jgi:WD40 repeat protein
MDYRRTCLVLSLAVAAGAAAQQPSKLPPIAPAAARLDQTLGGLDGPGLALAANDEAGIVVAGCERGTLPYWHKDVLMGIRAGEKTPHVLKGHQGPITALAWGGGSVLASAGADDKLLLWQMPDGKVLHTLPVKSAVRALALSPDGKLLASGGDDHVIQLWDVATGKPGDRLEGHTDWVVALAFSPDGKLLASGSYDGTVHLWDVSSGKKLAGAPASPPPPEKAPPKPKNIVWALTFTPDGKQLAAGGSDAQIHLLNVADGKMVRSIPGHTSTVTGLAFHPGGGVLASSSKDRTVRLWNPANAQALKSLEGHTAWVQGVTFLAQGTRLASVGADQTVRLWDLTEPAKK